MAEKFKFDREKQGLMATRNFAYSGVVGSKGKALDAKSIGKLSDAAVEHLGSRGLVEATSSAPSGEAESKGSGKK